MCRCCSSPFTLNEFLLRETINTTYQPKEQQWFIHTVHINENICDLDLCSNSSRSGVRCSHIFLIFYYFFIFIIYFNTYSSLAVDEFRDMALGERSKSESARYRKDSRLWLWEKLACSTRPEPGLAWDSSGLRPTDNPFSTSKLRKETQTVNTVDLGYFALVDFPVKLLSC